MGSVSLGGFEHQVLLTVLRLGGESYSVPMVLELEERTGRQVSQAAVFVTLRRLEKKGLLASRYDEATDTGHRRRYFAVTADGRESLRRTRHELLRLWDGVAGELDRA